MNETVRIGKRNILGAVEKLRVEDSSGMVKAITLTRDEPLTNPDWIGHQGSPYFALHCQTALEGHEVQDKLIKFGIDIIRTQHPQVEGFEIQVPSFELQPALHATGEFAEENILKIAAMQKEAAGTRRGYMEKLTDLDRQFLERAAAEGPEKVRQELQRVLYKTTQRVGR